MFRAKSENWFQDGDLLDSQSLADIRDNDLAIKNLHVQCAGNYIFPDRDYRFANWLTFFYTPAIIPPGVSKIRAYLRFDVLSLEGSDPVKPDPVGIRFGEGLTSALRGNTDTFSYSDFQSSDIELFEEFEIDVPVNTSARLTFLQLWMRGSPDESDPKSVYELPNSPFKVSEDAAGAPEKFSDDTPISPWPSSNANKFNFLINESYLGTPYDRPLPLDLLRYDIQPIPSEDPPDTWTRDLLRIHPLDPLDFPGSGKGRACTVLPFTGIRPLNVYFEFEFSEDFKTSSRRSDIQFDEPLSSSVPRAHIQMIDSFLAEPRPSAFIRDLDPGERYVIPSHLYGDTIDFLGIFEGGFRSNRIQFDIFNAENPSNKVTFDEDFDFDNDLSNPEKWWWYHDGGLRGVRSEVMMDSILANSTIITGEVSGVNDIMTTEEFGLSPLVIDPFSEFSYASEIPLALWFSSSSVPSEVSDVT